MYKTGCMKEHVFSWLLFKSPIIKCIKECSSSHHECRLRMKLHNGTISYMFFFFFLRPSSSAFCSTWNTRIWGAQKVLLAKSLKNKKPSYFEQRSFLAASKDPPQFSTVNFKLGNRINSRFYFETVECLMNWWSEWTRFAFKGQIREKGSDKRIRKRESLFAFAIFFFFWRRP